MRLVMSVSLDINTNLRHHTHKHTAHTHNIIYTSHTSHSSYKSCTSPSRHFTHTYTQASHTSHSTAITMLDITQTQTHAHTLTHTHHLYLYLCGVYELCEVREVCAVMRCRSSDSRFAGEWIVFSIVLLLPEQFVIGCAGYSAWSPLWFRRWDVLASSMSRAHYHVSHVLALVHERNGVGDGCQARELNSVAPARGPSLLVVGAYVRKSIFHVVDQRG